MRRGLTLIEILVALSIFAVGVTAVIGLLTVASTTHKRAINRVSAAWLAESLFDEMDARLTTAFDLADFPTVSGETRLIERDYELVGYDGYRADIYLTPLSDPDGQALGLPPHQFLCEIEIHWQLRGGANSERFRTILVRRLDVATGTQPGPPR